MTYRLFIDDERVANLKDNESMVIARTVGEAIDVMENMGCPSYISFDHDLGGDETGYQIAKWFVEKDMNEEQSFIPENFEFYVHSQNVCGKANIEGYLNGYLEHRSKTTDKPLTV